MKDGTRLLKGARGSEQAQKMCWKPKARRIKSKGRENKENKGSDVCSCWQ